MASRAAQCLDFRVARRQGCARSLNWAFAWRGPAVDARAVEAALVREGFVSAPTVAGLAHLEREDGSVLLVLRSLRVPLRIPYTIPLKIARARRCAWLAASPMRCGWLARPARASRMIVRRRTRGAGHTAKIALCSPSTRASALVNRAMSAGVSSYLD